VLTFLLSAGSLLYADNSDSALSEQEKDKYIENLVHKARLNRLHENTNWHVLLHYKKHGNNYKSLVDDPLFFLSDNGKTSPEQELEATIRSFFLKPREGKVHSTAKFSARFNWLKNELEIDESLLPYNGEEKFQNFFESLSPTGITLVFPAGYMNSPASMYGHTLLIIESEKQGRLLAKTANYAAITDETFGPVFAFKGLFGIYKGYFSFLPYYQKIKEYSDGEMRDMWEYELNLTPDEIEKVIRHIVEMEDIYSEYYFIDENCSFNLLYLLEVARPESGLTDSFFWSVEPIDTLRVVSDNNFIEKKVYRPSLYTKMQHLKSLLSFSEQSFVLSFCEGEIEIDHIDTLSLSVKKQIIMCDLAIEYLKFMATKGNITQADYRYRFFSVLSKRNSLPKDNAIPEIDPPVSPELSHRSQRITIEGGYRDNDYFTALSYRHTAHSLMDPDEGYNRNSQIVFGNISARYYYEEETLKLHRFDIIDLLSLPPSDRFFISACWDFKTGFIQNFYGEEEALSYYIKGASGLSTLLGDNVHLYGFAGLKSFFSSKYKNNTDFHVGGETGMLVALGLWKGHFYGNYYYVPAGYKRHTAQGGVSQRLKITTNVSVMADYSYNKNMDNSWHEASLNFNLYF
jgi:hypothetical protein